MFICARGHVTGPREREIRVPTEVRSREYFDKWGQPAGRGWEIVKEESLCIEHALEHGLDVHA